MVTELIRNPRAYIGQQRQKYTELLVDPETFYDERIGYRGIQNEIVLLLVVGIVGTIGMLFAVDTILEPFGTWTQAEMSEAVLDRDTSRQLWGQVVHPLVGIFVLWFLYTTAFYAISWLYTQQGSYFAILKRVAWGFLPMLFYNALYSIALIVAFWNAEIETDLPTGQPEVVAAFLLDQGRNEPVVLVAAVIGLVFVAWSGYIWSYAIEDARKIPRSDALKVAAIPVAIHIAYLAWTLLGRTVL